MRLIAAAFLASAFLMTALSCSFGGGDGVMCGRVIHGGGMMWSYDSGGAYRPFAVSNSREALLRCARMGAEYVELDFSLTSDGEAVCIHHWSPEYISGIDEGERMSLDDFRSSRIYGCFTPMTAADAARIIADSGMVLVTDFKDDFDLLLSEAARVLRGLEDRVVIQIYSMERYDDVRRCGFGRIAYSLYRLPWEEKLDAAAHIAFAAENELEWIGVSAELLEYGGFVGELVSAGVPVCVHTVNDIAGEEMLTGMGVGYICSDMLRQP